MMPGRMNDAFFGLDRAARTRLDAPPEPPRPFRRIRRLRHRIAEWLDDAAAWVRP